MSYHRESPLMKVPGIGEKLLSNMAESIRASGSSRLHVQQLLALGVPLDAATKIVDYWRSGAVDKCREDFHATLLESDRNNHVRLHVISIYFVHCPSRTRLFSVVRSHSLSLSPSLDVIVFLLLFRCLLLLLTG